MSEEKTVQMPVDKLSYSALTSLMRNPFIFKLRYILGVYDDKKGVSQMVGSAVHEALKFYYGGNKDIPVPIDTTEAQSMANEIGLEYLDTYNDAYIRYGKTGSREQMIKQYMQTMSMYWEEEPEYNEIVICEERLEAEILSYDGYKLPLPAVGIPDLVHRRKDGGVEIIDNKVVTSFTAYEDEDGEPFEDYVKIVQAKFLDRLLFASKGIKADRIVFREIKKSKNKADNGISAPQIRDYVIPTSHEPYDIIFDNLYGDAVKFISNPDSIYLPNITDRFDGQQAGLIYAQGLMNSDMSDVEVMHKVKDVAMVSKKFVSSKLDKIENANLLPEEKIRVKMAEFGIPMQPVGVQVGPSVTQYQFKVSAGIRMSTILKHKQDIAKAIESTGDVKILAPIPGTALVGIEVPRAERTFIKLGKKDFIKGTLSIPIGVDVYGQTVMTPLDDMPHLLIAGATRTGKSVFLSNAITALTKQLKKEELQMILIDPKRVELAQFKKLPHLKGTGIVYEYEDSMYILKSLVREMERRYKLLEEREVRDITEYNKDEMTRAPQYRKPLPYIVTVIDEFADLMAQGKAFEKKKKKKDSLSSAVSRIYVEKMARKYAKIGAKMDIDEFMLEDDHASVEELITRLAAMARAVGIHLIIATQRPSVDVITGLIKANFPTRISFTTSSAIDSKVILGKDGAEKLNGKGDMIYMHPGSKGEQRLQGFLI